MHVVARRLAGDPLRPARRVGDAPIDGGRELERHEGALGAQAGEEKRRVERRRFLLHQPEHDVYGSAPQHLETAAGLGVGIADRGHHTSDARRENRLSAGRRLAIVGTRLERHDQRRAPRGGSRSRERDDFSVVPAVLRVEALPDDGALPQHHRAHEWVGRDASPTPERELEGAAHRVRLRR